MAGASFPWRFALLAALVFSLLAPFLTAPTYDNRYLLVDKPDTSSPRSSLFHFLEFNSQSMAIYHSDGPVEEAEKAFRRTEVYLDTSEVAADSVKRIAADSSLLLYETLNRVTLPDWEQIPDASQAREQDLQAWVVPGTSIVLHRVNEGEREGEYLFSPQTIESSHELYQATKDRPYTTDYQPGNYEAYVNQPSMASGVNPDLLKGMPDWLMFRVYSNPVWKILACLLLLGLTLLAIERLYRYRNFSRIELSTGYQTQLLLILTAFGLLYAATGIIINVIGLRFGAVTLLSKALNGLAFVIGIYALFSLIMLFTEWLIARQKIASASIDASLLRASGKVVAGLIVLVSLVSSAEFLGLRLGPVLAGLGLGGLAVALAARSSLENIIAGFTLFADRPVRIGDYCEFGDQQGTVVSIGLRSTRIRDRWDRIITLPNADFSQMHIVNVTEIRHRLLRHSLGIRYEANDDQIRHLLVQLRRLLLGHPKVLEENLNVRLVRLADSWVELELYALVNVSDFHEFRAIQEDILLNVIRLVRQSSCEFAFPSQSLYLRRDPAPESEQAQIEAEQVSRWREEEHYPFPDFSEEQIRAWRDRLDYPVQPGKPGEEQ